MRGKFSKPLEELGKWFLNVGLATYVAVILQPLVKGTETVSFKGFLAVLIAVGIGFGLILLSESIKKEV
jgi:Na+/H+ antiporter NhaA